MIKPIVILASLPIMIAMMTAISQIDLPLAFGQSPLANLGQGTNATNSNSMWTTFNGSNIPITFEHPANWTDIKLKESRFDTGTHLVVRPAEVLAFTSFKIIKFASKYPDLTSFAEAASNSFAGGLDTKLIEDINFTAYNIDGDKAANLVYTFPLEFGE